MATTSLKLPDEIKQRVAAAAKSQGITTHAFMVEAIKLAATAAEQRARFVADAQAARKALLKGGQGFDPDEVHAYLRARAGGKKASPPRAKAWRG